MKYFIYFFTMGLTVLVWGLVFFGLGLLCTFYALVSENDAMMYFCLALACVLVVMGTGVLPKLLVMHFSCGECGGGKRMTVEQVARLLDVESKSVDPDTPSVQTIQDLTKKHKQLQGHIKKLDRCIKDLTSSFMPKGPVKRQMITGDKMPGEWREVAELIVNYGKFHDTDDGISTRMAKVEGEPIQHVFPLDLVDKDDLAVLLKSTKRKAETELLRLKIKIQETSRQL